MIGVSVTTVPVPLALMADVVLTRVAVKIGPASYDDVIVTYGSAEAMYTIPGIVPEGAMVDVVLGAPGPPSLRKLLAKS